MNEFRKLNKLCGILLNLSSEIEEKEMVNMEEIADMPSDAIASLFRESVKAIIDLQEEGIRVNKKNSEVHPKDRFSLAKTSEKNTEKEDFHEETQEVEDFCVEEEEIPWDDIDLSEEEELYVEGMEEGNYDE